MMTKRSSRATLALVALVVGSLLAPVAGRDCTILDVFPEGIYTNAIISSDCTSLNLNNNVVGDLGAIAIAGALKENTALTTLELDSNNIGARGATALAEALKVNTHLSTLWLEGNSIGDVGATAIAAALTVNTALTTLDMYYNFVGDAGATALLHALKFNTMLTEMNVDITNTIIDTTITDALSALLAENQKATDATNDEAVLVVEKDAVEPSTTKLEEANEGGQGCPTLQPSPPLSPLSSSPPTSSSSSPQTDADSSSQSVDNTHTLSGFLALQACPLDSSTVLLDTGSCGQIDDDSESLAHIATSDLCEAAAVEVGIGYESFKVIDEVGFPSGCFYHEKVGALFWNNNAGTEHTKPSRTSLCCEQDDPNEVQIQICPTHSTVVLLGGGSCDQSDTFANFAHVESSYLCEAAAAKSGIEDFEVIDSVESPTGCSYSAETGVLFWNNNSGTEQPNGSLTSLCCESVVQASPAAPTEPSTVPVPPSKAQTVCPTKSSAVLLDTGSCDQSDDSDSFAHIASSNLCKSAAQEAGVPYKTFDVIDDSASSTGCFFYEKDGALFFNKNMGTEHKTGTRTSLCCEQDQPDTTHDRVCPANMKAVLLDEGTCKQSDESAGFLHIKSSDLCRTVATSNNIESFEVIDNSQFSAGCFYVAEIGTLYWNENPKGTESSTGTMASVCCESAMVCPTKHSAVLLDSGTCNQSEDTETFFHVATSEQCEGVAVEAGVDYKFFEVIDTIALPAGCFFIEREGTIYWNKNVGTERKTGSMASLCCEQTESAEAPVQICPMHSTAVLLVTGSCDQSDAFANFAHIGSFRLCEAVAVANDIESVERLDSAHSPRGCFYSADKGALFWNQNQGVEHSNGSLTNLCCKSVLEASDAPPMTTIRTSTELSNVTATTPITASFAATFTAKLTSTGSSPTTIDALDYCVLQIAQSTGSSCF